MSDITISNCEKEPIHIPGLIQTFGILLCVDTPELKISQISNNVEQILGRTPSSFLGQSLKSLISVQDFESIQVQLSSDKEKTPFRQTFLLKKDNGTSDRWMGFVHYQDKKIILELEKHSEQNFEELFHATEASMAEIQSALSLQSLCESATREIQRLTGYDRVMLYKFDPVWNGEVIAESRSGTGVDSFLGHRFPGSDIPPQARAVFLSNWVRTIPDVDYTPIPIIPTLHPQTGHPLDLSQSFLRAVSPFHIQYLKNMNVRSTLTISLIKDGQLWGLIACHHSKPRLIAYDARATCQFMGKLISSQLDLKEKIEDTARIQKLHSLLASLEKSMNREDDQVKGLVNYSPNILDLFGTKDVSAALRIDDQWTLVGITPIIEQINRLADWLNIETRKTSQPLFYTHQLSRLFPEAKDYTAIASGIIAVSIPKTDRSFIIWFKPEVVQTVTWAGNPTKSIEKLADGTLKIEPRSSFESWKETVTSQSVAWTKPEIAVATDLRNSILSIDLRRQFNREQRVRAEAERISREKGDVLATVSHDLKNPLFSMDLIIQWFEKKYRDASHSELRSETFSKDIGSVVSNVKTSTRRMQRLINDLLDLAKIEEGTFSLDLKHSDVCSLVTEAVNLLQPQTLAKGITLKSICPSDIYRLLDEDRIMQVLSNLVANAIKFTPEGGQISVLVEVRGEELRVSVCDSGAGIPADHLPHVFDRFWQASETNKMGTGLGLAICKGIVEACGGNIWIESKLGRGTSVSFTLPGANKVKDFKNEFLTL
jgi:two-component system, chemotaxis family, sensor kinase Cph1